MKQGAYSSCPAGIGGLSYRLGSQSFIRDILCRRRSEALLQLALLMGWKALEDTVPGAGSSFSKER